MIRPRQSAADKGGSGSPANQIRWVFAGGTNLDPAKDTHVHGATVTIVDDDHLVIDGEAWADGKPSENHCGQIKIVRKK